MDLFLWIGLIGQGFFSIRFFVQWIASEKAGESIIPVSFWFFSILGIFLQEFGLYP